MKIIKMISVAMLLALFLPIIADGAQCEGWYIVKRKNETPGFPKSASELDTHSCYYIDKTANERGDKVLYLTFDAGYENGNVEKVLDIMKEEKVTGAFFVLANIINKNTELIRRMSSEGHLVCNHTKNHKNLSKLTNDEIEENLRSLEDLCQEKAGVKMSPYFRFPEGVYSEESIKAVESLGYKTFFWSMAYADWDNGRQPEESKAIKTLLDQTHPGAVILLHPTSETNSKILSILIRSWKDMGYRFGTLDELVAKN